MEERKFNAPPHPTRPAVTPSPPHDTAGPHRSGPQRCRVTPERTARLLRPHQAPGLRCTGEPAIPRAAQGAPGAPRGGGAAAPQLPPGPSARHRGAAAARAQLPGGGSGGGTRRERGRARPAPPGAPPAARGEPRAATAPSGRLKPCRPAHTLGGRGPRQSALWLAAPPANQSNGAFPLAGTPLPYQSISRSSRVVTVAAPRHHPPVSLR